ncbi:hypothetical protein EQG49_09225 [Periweissella cryptocerci]|uniref:MucBP domain-containing protein n=1 Tax=Periweissella cryptocerci TaxID=2506420 RepID=A0A4P6YV99_9LACO|nr:MucBP domain-containing protein [Periweissella cryptocerci]QBO36637.1 hypothetical protein EQG49_09225 [Periweissella cryptocerci]
MNKIIKKLFLVTISAGLIWGVVPFTSVVTGQTVSANKKVKKVKKVKKAQKVNITVKYVSGNKILKSTKVKVNKGKKFKAKKLSFSGYKAPKKIKAVKVSKPKTIKIKYTAKKYKITLKHVNGSKILKKTTKQVKYGTKYKVSPEKFTGLKHISSSVSSFTVKGNRTITLKYAKNASIGSLNNPVPYGKTIKIKDKYGYTQTIGLVTSTKLLDHFISVGVAIHQKTGFNFYHSDDADLATKSGVYVTEGYSDSYWGSSVFPTSEKVYAGETLAGIITFDSTHISNNKVDNYLVKYSVMDADPVYLAVKGGSSNLDVNDLIKNTNKSNINLLGTKLP